MKRWKEEVESDIEETNGAEKRDLAKQITSAMATLGLRAESSSDDAESTGSNGPPLEAGQEFNYNGFRGPFGKQSLRRYAIHGTVGLIAYASDNAAKFDAYGSRVQRDRCRMWNKRKKISQTCLMLIPINDPNR